MKDNSNGCETIVNIRQVWIITSKFGHMFYILASSGPCRRSESVNHPILDV